MAEGFDIDTADVVGYHSGICYDKVWVRTREAAEKVAGVMRGRGKTVNGGWFHGMALGGITEYDGKFEVMV